MISLVSATTTSKAAEPAAERPSTRDRIVLASAELFRRQGYAGTGLKQIAAEGEATFGSLYHFFPGGKEELGATTVREAGAFFLLLVEGYLDQFPDIAEAVSEYFDGAAQTLVNTDYEDACPIATIALETASTSEPMQIATADAFESWLHALRARFEAAGIEAGRSEALALAVLSALEGAFVLCRAQRTTEPMVAAREMAVAAIETALRR